MRLITFMVAIIAASAPAGAQSWKEYEYPNEGFTVAFPAEPKVETTSYQASGRRLVEARVYSVVQEGGEFKVTVADLSHTEMSEGNVMASPNGSRDRAAPAGTLSGTPDGNPPGSLDAVQLAPQR